MSTAEEQYMQEIGRRVLEEQLAAQQQQSAPVDSTVAQANRTQQILMERANRERDEKIRQAQERQRQTDKQRAKQREEDQQARAVQVETEARQQKYVDWVGANLPADDFDAWWRKTGLQEWRTQQASNYQTTLRSAWVARFGNPF